MARESRAITVSFFGFTVIAWDPLTVQQQHGQHGRLSDSTDASRGFGFTVIAWDSLSSPFSKSRCSGSRVPYCGGAWMGDPGAWIGEAETPEFRLFRVFSAPFEVGAAFGTGESGFWCCILKNYLTTFSINIGSQILGHQ